MATTDVAHIECIHGHILMQEDSAPCPDCNAEAKTPHTPDLVQIRPDWATTTYTRCRNCGRPGRHPAHRA